jgi:hypothetical protein
MERMQEIKKESVMSKKIITAAVAGAMLLTASFATTAEAKPYWGGPHWGGYHHGRGWGLPVAAGLLGLAAVGAVAASDCYFASQPVADPYGNVYYRRVRVCN